MKKDNFWLFAFGVFVFILSGCGVTMKSDQSMYLTDTIPDSIPVVLFGNLVPPDQIIHKGIFSPDFSSYYYTLSDKNFLNFNVYTIKKKEGEWSDPEPAFFNSEFNEHGMSFSPDGNTLYFSSTRPTNEDIPETWHLWKSVKVGNEWKKPTFIDIPNLRDRLVSHPSINKQGTLYFHVSNLDYSNMDIYESQRINNAFGPAKKVSIDLPLTTGGRCTPFVSPEGDYLIYAVIGSTLDLYISHNDRNGNWIHSRKLKRSINHASQGNPFVTADKKYLIFTSEGEGKTSWRVKWVDIQQELQTYSASY